MSIAWKKTIASLLAATFMCCSAPVNAENQSETQPLFFAKPYLQLGNHPQAASKESEDVLWLSKEKKNWAVDVKPHDSKIWKQNGKPITHRPLADSLQPNLEIYSCELVGLKPGALFDYRIRTDQEQVFQATGLAVSYTHLTLPTIYSV